MEEGSTDITSQSKSTFQIVTDLQDRTWDTWGLWSPHMWQSKVMCHMCWALPLPLGCSAELLYRPVLPFSESYLDKSLQKLVGVSAQFRLLLLPVASPLTIEVKYGTSSQGFPGFPFKRNP